MRIRKRAAIWIAVAAVVLSLAAAGWRATRPEYLRKQILALGQGLLTEEWRLEIRSVDYHLFGGVARIEGIRLVRNDTGAAAVTIPSAEAEISFAALFGRGRLASEIRILKPEITLEVDAQRKVPLFEAFRGGGGKAPAAHPRLRVTDGVVTVLDRADLAEGESIVLAVQSLDFEESRSGEPAGISGTLVEKGAPGNEAGAIGTVRVSGEYPWTKAALRVSVDRFDVGEPLQKRLAPAIREKLAPLQHLAGAFGEEGSPALEVTVSGPDMAHTTIQATARPRDLEVTLRDYKYPLTKGTGEITYTSIGESKVIGIKALELHHDPGTTFKVEGSVELSSSPDAPFEVNFSAKNLMLDQELHDAYPESLKKVWDTYAFTGEVDVGIGDDFGPKGRRNFLRRKKGGPLEVDITAVLTNAGLSFKGPRGADGQRHGFDWPVEGVTGTVAVKVPAIAEAATSILLMGVRGKHRGKGGDTEVTAEGSVSEWSDRSKVDITLGAKDVPLDESVRNCSPIIANIFEQYGPRGRLADLHVHIEQEDIPGAPTLATVVGEFGGKGGMTFREMPLPVDGLSGTVTYGERLLNGKKAVITEISGVRGTTAEGAAVFADGTIEGEGNDAMFHLRIRADSILLDGELQDAIRKSGVAIAHDLWKNMKPSGPADLVVDVLGPQSKLDYGATLTLRGSYLQGWGEVGFPVADLTGTAEFKGGTLDLHTVRGLHGGREVTLAGGGQFTDERTMLDLKLTTTGFPLDETARGILGPTLSEKLSGYFTTVRPAAGLEGDVEIRLQGPGSDLEPTVKVDNLRGGAAPFDLKDLVFGGGTVRYADGAIFIEHLLGTMGDRQLSIPTGGLRFDRGEGNLTVEVRRLRFPADLVGLIPAETAAAIEEVLPERFIHFEGLKVALSEGWRRIEMNGGVSLTAQKEGGTGGLGLVGTFSLDRFTFLRGESAGDPTAVSGGIDIVRGAFDAGVRVQDFSGRLDFGGSFGNLGRGIEGTLSGGRARVVGRELKDAGGELLLRDGVFTVKSLRGDLAGGAVGLSVEVGGRRALDGVVTLSNARARDFLAPADPDSPIRGQIDATVRFRRPQDPGALLVGDGQVDIKNGKLFEVPVFNGISRLAQSLPFVRSSDPPEFTSGHLVFNISGDKLAFQEVELDSPVVAIHRGRGKSAAYVDGRLDMNLRAEIKVDNPLWQPGKWAATLVSPLLGGILAFYVRGTVQRPEVSWFNPDLLGSTMKDGPVFPLPTEPAFPVEPRAPWDF